MRPDPNLPLIPAKAGTQVFRSERWVESSRQVVEIAYAKVWVPAFAGMSGKL
jgi:hypothetical protein